MNIEVNFVRVCPRCNHRIITDRDELSRCPECMQYVCPVLVNASAEANKEKAMSGARMTVSAMATMACVMVAMLAGGCASVPAQPITVKGTAAGGAQTEINLLASPSLWKSYATAWKEHTGETLLLHAAGITAGYFALEALDKAGEKDSDSGTSATTVYSLPEGTTINADQVVIINGPNTAPINQNPNNSSSGE